MLSNTGAHTGLELRQCVMCQLIAISCSFVHVEWTTCCYTSKNWEFCSNQHEWFAKRSIQNSQACQIIWRKYFTFGLKLVRIWQCKWAYFQPCEQISWDSMCNIFKVWTNYFYKLKHLNASTVSFEILIMIIMMIFLICKLLNTLVRHIYRLLSPNDLN